MAYQIRIMKSHWVLGFIYIFIDGVTSETTVEALKRKIQIKTNTERDEIRLSSKGKILESYYKIDDKTMRPNLMIDYGIRKDSVVHMSMLSKKYMTRVKVQTSLGSDMDMLPGFC
ncbi:hypothetical protein HK097_011161 [Rhizophlyctis rosea]|uniref:Ubiquitin-like domain-containing protein n=1 Tax=Rhizophlyctis rosea TaxID=64517 RepID=A0AAD5S9F5_9FUNG|nr:hypothetical protein HK097_011161 [Rhizophlyctis rosea]